MCVCVIISRGQSISKSYEWILTKFCEEVGHGQGGIGYIFCGDPNSSMDCGSAVIDGCFEDVLQQWSLFFVVDCRLPSDGSH